MVEALYHHALRRPERPAIALEQRVMSYGELYSRVLAAADTLAACGVCPGDRVLIAAHGSAGFAIAYFATHLARAISVPMDANAPIARVRELCARVRPKLVLASPTLLQTRAEPAHERPAPIVLALDTLESGASAAHGASPRFPHENELADVLFTTGTTGRAKGVMLSHRSQYATAARINKVIGNGARDSEVVTLPLGHSFGLGRLRCNVLAGGCVALCDGVRLPGAIFGALQRASATGLTGVPASFAVLLRFGERGLGAFAEQLRYVEIGSAPMPLAHKRQLMQLLPRTALWMHYGLTEASRSTFLELHRDSAHLDTIGLPSPGVQVSIRDEQDRELGAGERGALWLKSESVASGYFGDPGGTARAFERGWVRSGDVAHLDASGFVTLHGRHDDMINVGGYSVAPEEIERELCEHPAFAAAACIGVPDPKGISGSAIKACVVLAAGCILPAARELAHWLAPRLEPYKIPTLYQVIAELPRTASGKLRRAVLRAAARDRAEAS